MAITRGAKKAYRSSLRKRTYNVRRKVALHDAVKTLHTLIQEGKHAEATARIPTVYKAIDKAQKTGVIKKNTANRTKSRLMRQVGKLVKQ